MNEDLRRKIRLNMIGTGAILLTIALIIFENVTKRPRYYSLIALSIAFLIMGLVQFFTYKIDKRIKNIIFAIIYILIAIANLYFLFIKK